MEWWSSGGERGKSWILAFSSGLFNSLSRTSRWAGGPRDQAGACRAPEPSPWLLTGQFQVLKWQWTSPPSPPWPPNDHSRLCIMRSEGPAPSVWAIWGAWGPAASWTPRSLSKDSWVEVTLRSCQLRPAYSQSGPGPQRVKVVPGDLALSCQNRE